MTVPPYCASSNNTTKHAYPYSNGFIAGLLACQCICILIMPLMEFLYDIDTVGMRIVILLNEPLSKRCKSNWYGNHIQNLLQTP